MSEVEFEFEEVLKKLINEVLEDPERYPSEAKMILVLEVWHRQGEAFSDYQRYEIVQGDVIEVTLEEFSESYPYRRGRKVALIPLAVPTVIKVSRYSDTTDPPVKECTLHVFTSEGWKSVKVY